jgi:hypothetical protein
MLDSLTRTAKNSELFRRAMTVEVFRRPVEVVGFGMELQRRTQGLRRALRIIAPDAVLSFLTQTNILTLLAARGLPIRVVVSERNDPTRQHHNLRVAVLRNLLYRRSHMVTANSAGAIESLASFVPRQKLALLPNPLSVSDCGAPVTFARPTIIRSRVSARRGLDVLLKAGACLEAAAMELAIIGDGPLREVANAARVSTSRVDWLGYLVDPISEGAKFFRSPRRVSGRRWPAGWLRSSQMHHPALGTDRRRRGPGRAGRGCRSNGGAIVSLPMTKAFARLGEAAVKRTEMYQVDRPCGMAQPRRHLECGLPFQRPSPLVPEPSPICLQLLGGQGHDVTALTFEGWRRADYARQASGLAGSMLSTKSGCCIGVLTSARRFPPPRGLKAFRPDAVVAFTTEPAWWRSARPWDLASRRGVGAKPA